MRRCLATILITGLSLILSGCGNGGGGGTVAEGGIGGTGVSSGRVTQVGSVYVNGTQYDTETTPTEFIINGDSNRSLSDISVGMVVTVTGSRDPVTATGIANSVVYTSLLVGPIDTIDPTDTSTLGVMGQSVRLNIDTVFDNPLDSRLLEELTTADYVEVSGFADSVNGEILATRIVVSDSSGPFTVTGTTRGYDPVAQTLQIGTLIIDLAAIDPAGVPADGSYVHITGATAPRNGHFAAQSLQALDNGVAGEDGTEAELEGVIASGLDASNRFIVNGQIVDASGTPYSNDPVSLAVGRVVSVSGVLESGILLADEIDLKASSTEREEISAIVQLNSVDTQAGTVLLMGRTIRTDNDTIYESDISGLSNFRLSDVLPGHYLEAKVYDNLVVLRASKLELETPPSSYDAKLEGYATWLVPGKQIEILDVPVDIANVASYSHNPAERIKVKGDYDLASGILRASSIQVDD